jgi:MFS transporter, DHA3 family, macrolide efflux protein
MSHLVLKTRGDHLGALSMTRHPLTQFMRFEIGQFVSYLGSAMQFALMIWAWQITGEVTALALVSFFTFVPSIIVGPFAGALVYRWNRKHILIVADTVAALVSSLFLILILGNQLQIWHLYVAGAIIGIAQAFQFPAMSASITLMVPEAQLARANALLGLASSGAAIFAPSIAGALLPFIDLQGVILIDLLTFIVGIITLIQIPIPQPKTSSTVKNSLATDAIFGFHFILQHSGLRGLTLIFFIFFMSEGFGFAAQIPMILIRSDNNEVILGIVRSLTALGAFIGGVILSVWGGSKQRIHIVLLGLIASSLLGRVVLGLGYTLPIWAIAAFVQSFFIPFIVSSDEAIWQTQVPPDQQGRVFAT